MEKDYLMLCLYHRNSCISSVTLNIKDTTITIESKTHEDYESKKFNKLMRCITIIICDKLICNIGEKLKTIVSYPINKISSWLLISNFETHIFDSEEQPINLDMSNLKIQIFGDKIKIGKIIVPLNENNISKAYVLFNKLISSDSNDIGETIICS